jgi:tRNA ligase
LHGLNKNQGLFSTAPPAEVDAFAAEYGFIQTASFSLPSIKEVREFTDKIAESGKWQGEPVEGFVVRTSIARSTSLSSPGLNSNSGDARPPYPPGTDFFFKIKFDEPYLMYRAWREITKTILAYKAKSPLERSKNPLNIPRSRLARPESRLYRDWVEKEIEARPGDFKDFSKGRNIIATRDRFLRWLETGEGRRRLELNDKRSLSPTEGKGKAIYKEKRVWGKTVIVPVAVPGSGMLHRIDPPACWNDLAF